MSLDITHPNLTLDVLAFLFGICIGSFLNVVAIRSLAEESLIWPPSHCTRCNHQLSPWDNIPVVSYVFLLRGKCRYCKAGIHWQYPVVELFTAFSFVAIERIFLSLPTSPFNITYWNNCLLWFISPDRMEEVVHLHDFLPIEVAWPLMLGAGIFACTLIAVTVTDFREKLIPHEITYPSMIVGLIFSSVVRNDLLGALAGVGASYILFDFIAFYGLKVYNLMHGGTVDEYRTKPRLLRRIIPSARRRMGRGLSRRRTLATVELMQSPEETMAMQDEMQNLPAPKFFGDPIIASIIGAFLGWQMIIVALIAGFIAGKVSKPIPRGITYPLIICGIVYSSVIRHDPVGALAAIGASYVFFDFIGLSEMKFHSWTQVKRTTKARVRKLRRAMAPRFRRRMGRGLRWRIDLASVSYVPSPEEPTEVMGGGDAVLSAVMAAYLGWQLLVIALMIGFILGTLMGLGLLVHEMIKAKLLHNCLRRSIIFGTAGATVFGGLGILFPDESKVQVATTMGLFGFGAGAMLGVVSVGTSVSKPYPFGPALAMGGFIAMFLLPNWIWMSPPLH